ncbi:MAG: UbiA family prenyltransferase [Cyclobacteriaceae bacterium]
MANTFSNLLYSIRPSACLGVSLFALASYQDLSKIYISTLIFVATFSGSAACFLINDIVDRKKDLLNKKHRPISTGALSLGIAKWVSVILILAYMGLSALLSVNNFILSVLTVSIFLFYPGINNRNGLLSNALVAISVSMSFLYGVIIKDIDLLIWAIMVSSFFIIIAREIMLDGLDIAGDKAFGKPSIPISFGENGAFWSVAFGFVLGTIALIYSVFQSTTTSSSIILILAIFALWIPLVISKFQSNLNWMLFNVRSTHLFFALIIAALFLR